jgi:peptidoglycan/xylan/chitin deacetylase (PgdA/CDA1 family)
LPTPTAPAPPLFTPELSETYADPKQAAAIFPFITFGETDGRGSIWASDDPSTPQNEELEAICRAAGVPKAERFAGVCNGKRYSLDPSLHVTQGCLRLRYVRSSNCSPAGLVDADSDPSTPPTVPENAGAFRRGYIVGDTNGSPTDFKAFQHPTNDDGQSAALVDSTVRVRFNPSGLQQTPTPGESFSVYTRYVSEDDHYVATLRRAPAATDCTNDRVTCDADGNVLETEGQLIISERLCGGPLVELARVSAPMVEDAWYAFELTALGSQLYASITTHSSGGFPIFKQLRVDLNDAAAMQQRRLALGMPELTREDYPADLPAGTNGIRVQHLAAYVDDWTTKPTGTTVCPKDAPLQTLLLDDDVDFFGAGTPMQLCPGWGYSAVAGDCNDFLRAYRPGAPEACGFTDFNCDGVVQAPETCAVPVEPPQRQGESAGIVLDDALTAQRRWVGRVNGSLVANSVLYSTDPTSPQADHEIISMTTPGDGRRVEIERTNINPPISFCDETNPYLVPDDPATPAFDGVPNLKYLPKLAVKVKNETNARDIALYLGDSSFANIYRLRFRSGQGEVYVTENEWVSFSMSLENTTEPLGKPDPCKITRVRLRAVDDGTKPVTLSMDALTKVPRSLDFPTGVVSFTFDDGFLSTYTEAAPCLDGSDAACQVPGGNNAPIPTTIYPIISALGSYLPEENDYFMSVEQLDDLHARGWDIGVHAFDQDVHSTSYPRRPEPEGRSDMRAAKQWLFDRYGAGSGYENMAYPKGEFFPGSFGEVTNAESLARTEFTSARTINWQLRELPTPSNMHRLRVRYVTRTTTLDEIRKAIEIAERNAEWVIFVFHDFAHSPEELQLKSYFVLAEDFRAMVRMVREPGRTIQLKNVSQVMGILPLF